MKQIMKKKLMMRKLMIVMKNMLIKELIMEKKKMKWNKFLFYFIILINMQNIKYIFLILYKKKYIYIY